MNNSDLNKYNKPVIKKDQPDDSYKFLPLPIPQGNYPYRLHLNEIVPGAIDEKMIFHMVGDTGSVREPAFQKLVVNAMTRQYQTESIENKPQFLFHLGDVVYNYGEAENYAGQFFIPFENYPAPIVAIAGNHDSDVNPDANRPYQSLDAFTTVFCDTIPGKVIFGGSSKRKSMVQPNVYWVLDTPLATIIGLHSNVPKYGVITKDQRSWFAQQLLSADFKRPGKAIIVCVHHSPYSADINHGSSQPMINFFEGVFDETKVRPDIVFSGHVHNYQRFTKQYADGEVPYIVAGAGGFDELHAIASKEDSRFTSNSPLFDGVQLKSYCDDKYGFLKITLERKLNKVVLMGAYYTVSKTANTMDTPEPILTDEFVVEIR